MDEYNGCVDTALFERFFIAKPRRHLVNAMVPHIEQILNKEKERPIMDEYNGCIDLDLLEDMEDRRREQERKNREERKMKHHPDLSDPDLISFNYQHYLNHEERERKRQELSNELKSFLEKNPIPNNSDLVQRLQKLTNQFADKQLQFILDVKLNPTNYKGISEFSICVAGRRHIPDGETFLESLGKFQGSSLEEVLTAMEKHLNIEKEIMVDGRKYRLVEE